MNKKALWLLSLLAMVPFLVSGAYEWLCQTVCDGTILAVIWMGVLLLAALCHTLFGKRPVDDEMNRQKLRMIKDTGIALLVSCMLCFVALVLGKTLTALGIQEELSSYHIIALSSVLLGVLLFFLYAHYAKPHASRNAGSSGTEGGNHEGVLLMLLVTATVGCQILTPLPMHLLFLTVFALLEIHVLMPGTQPSVPPPGKDLTDLLGREKVVSDCIERLKTPKKRTGEACNLALTGPWGSGKTFIMELVYNKLREDPAIHVIRLNPWHLQTLADIHKAVIQAIYSTVRAPSCFSSPALLWCLRSIASLCDAQSSTRFSEALERLVLNPGSMHTAGDVAALNAAIRKPVIIFLDDLERLNKNVLEQVLPMIDSLSQVNKLRFFVAINTETFNEFKTTRTEAAGYFHKVFTDHIELPSFQEEYYVDYVRHFLNTNKVDSTSKDMIMSIFEAPPLDEGVGISAYHPCKIRTLIHSLHALVSIASSPLQELVQSTDESKECSRILSIIHFFNCLKEEDPHFYNMVKEATPGTRVEVIKEFVNKDLKKTQEHNSNNDHTNTRHKELSFLQRIAFQNNEEVINCMWPEDKLEFALDGFLYSILNMTNDQVRHMVNEAMANKGIVEPKGNTETETKAIISIFWNKLITIMLSHAEAPELNIFQTIVARNRSQIEDNKHSIIKKLDTYMYGLFAPLSEGRQKAAIETILLNLSIGDATSFYEKQRIHEQNDGLQNTITDRICFFFEKELAVMHTILSINDCKNLAATCYFLPHCNKEKVISRIPCSYNNPCAHMILLNILCVIRNSWFESAATSHRKNTEKTISFYVENNMILQHISDILPETFSSSELSNLSNMKKEYYLTLKKYLTHRAEENPNNEVLNTVDARGSSKIDSLVAQAIDLMKPQQLAENLIEESMK